MAMFRKKGNGQNGDGPPDPDSGFSPEKAKAFYDRAEHYIKTGDYAYSMVNFLNGVGLDPTNMDGLSGFLRAADLYVDAEGKKANTKEVAKTLPKRGGVDKYVDALLSFGVKKEDTATAVKATEAAAGLGLREPARLIGGYALATALQSPKQKKDHFIRLLNTFEKIESYDLAVRAGEVAYRLDPTDGPLQARVRNMMAASTMSSGGFDDAGQEGGFRRNIRDAKKQAELEQQDSFAKTESTKDQIVARAAQAHEENPEDVPSLTKLAEALVARGKPADELKAMGLYGRAYKQTGQFRFRKLSGEIQLRRTKRSVLALRQAAEASPDDVVARDRFQKGLAELRKQETEELRLQVENYPTDLTLKLRLGRAYFDQDLYNEAIEQFQEAQNDPKARKEVLSYMGRAFLRLGGWVDAAVETFRRAIGDGLDDASELGMELRYGLMSALLEKANADRDDEAAEEADRLAAGIAIQKFNYRDVQQKREAIKQLRAELRG